MSDLLETIQDRLLQAGYEANGPEDIPTALHEMIADLDQMRAVIATLGAGTVAQEPVHPDDEAVDRFAIAMKAKLAKKRAQGYGGWDRPEECTIVHLSQLLRKHINKGDPVDVGNFSMMIHQRGGSIE